MSWLYSQALVEEYSGGTCSDGALSVPLSGNPTQQAYCSPDKMTEFSRLSRFGMTFKPLTESLGQDVLMLYLEDFPVKTFLLLDEAQELTELDPECGHTWQELLAKWNPDTSMWKTPQCSLLEDSEPSLETWPRWGLMQDGVSYRRQPLVRHIKETGFGSWPTPVRSDHEMRRPTEKWKGTSDLVSVVWTETGGRENPNQPPALLNPTWVEWLMGWPLGWTDLKPLAMDKYQQWQQQHGGF